MLTFNGPRVLHFGQLADRTLCLAMFLPFGVGGERIWFLLPPWGVALLSLVFHSSGLGLEGQGAVCGCAVWVFIPKGQAWLESSAAPTAQLDVGAGIMAVPGLRKGDLLKIHGGSVH